MNNLLLDFVNCSVEILTIGGVIFSGTVQHGSDVFVCIITNENKCVYIAVQHIVSFN